MKKKGGNLKRVKRQNVSLIKEMIYKNRLISRSEIAEKLALTLPTVTAVVNQMLEEGILEERPELYPARELGRRPIPLDFSENSIYFIGIELKPYDTVMCILSLAGSALLTEKFPVSSENYNQMTGNLIKQIEMLIKAGKVPREKIAGIGIAVSGIINYEEGKIYRNIHKDWCGRHFADEITNGTGIKTVIENNVRIRAFATELVGVQTEGQVFRKEENPERIPESFAYFFVSAGIACSLVIKDSVYIGHQARAGELGHTIVIPDGPKCGYCGNNGCLDAVAGERVILRRYRAIVERRTGEKRPDVTIKDVLQDYQSGDPQTTVMLNEMVKYMSIALTNIINFVSPQTIYIDGYIFRDLGLQEKIMEITNNDLYLEDKTEISFVPYDSFGGAKAAAFFALKEIFIK